MADAAADTAKAKPEGADKLLGKRELVDRVVESSGVKKGAAKKVVEATLLELGKPLSSGENLNLQPFGRCMVQNKKDIESGEVLNLRLRRSLKTDTDTA